MVLPCPHMLQQIDHHPQKDKIMTAQEVTDYINKLNDKAGQEWQVEVSNQLHKIAQDNIPDFSEKLQYGKPHFFKNGKYAAVLGTAKGWVTFTIFNATE